MSYSEANDLINNAEWAGRVQVCAREQALIFSDDGRPEYYGLAYAIISDPRTEPYDFCFLLASQPGISAESTDGDILAAVQAIWPKVGQAYAPEEAPA